MVIIRAQYPVCMVKDMLPTIISIGTLQLFLKWYNDCKNTRYYKNYLQVNGDPERPPNAIRNSVPTRSATAFQHNRKRSVKNLWPVPYNIKYKIIHQIKHNSHHHGAGLMGNHHIPGISKAVHTLVTFDY